MLVVGSPVGKVAGAPVKDGSCGRKRGSKQKGQLECGKRPLEEGRQVESSTEIRKKAVGKVTAARKVTG